MNDGELWRTLCRSLDPSAADIDQGELLLSEYRALGYLRRTCRDILQMPDAAIAHLYARLEADGQGRSPVADQPDSRWMVDADFCFVNVRATGLGEAFGTLIQAAKLLPAIRASAIHLGPFTAYGFGVIYVVTSVETIAPHSDGYPEFQYLDRNGHEPGGKICGVLAPIAFYRDLPASRIPPKPPAINRVAVDYYCQIFVRWRDRYGFDFVRHDSVDHVFDSVVDGKTATLTTLPRTGPARRCWSAVLRRLGHRTSRTWATWRSGWARRSRPIRRWDTT